MSGTRILRVIHVRDARATLDSWRISLHYIERWAGFNQRTQNQYKYEKAQNNRNT
jgi:hypothetical protein